jgi:hypothetical protein
MSTCCNQSFPSNKWLQVYGGTFKKEVSLTMCMTNHYCCPNSSWILSCAPVFLFSLGWGFLLFFMLCRSSGWGFFVQTWNYPVHLTIDLSKSLQFGLKYWEIFHSLEADLHHKVKNVNNHMGICLMWAVNKCFVDPFALKPLHAN